MKILTTGEMRKAVAAGKMSPSALTLTQQERLARGIQASIEALAAAVAKSGGGESIAGQLKETTQAVTKLRDTIAGMAGHASQSNASWTFTVQRDAEHRIAAIQATKGK